jgi:SAM-dependent methyltransferase
MRSVPDHYEKHLGPVYLWMLGDFDAALERSAAELDALGIAPRQNVVAVDLGAGPGLHTIPLARRGYSVTAIDTCPALLEELKSRAGPLSVRTVDANLLAFRDCVQGPIDLVLCMGDTLTHLPDLKSVQRLFDSVAASLAKDGVFAMSFRDYATAPLEGDGRFILVRSDQHRVMTCFLEYAQDTVAVHDLLHETHEGRWQLKISSYPKLRLSPDWVIEDLRSRGFDVRREPASAGMVRIAARQP